MKEIAYAGRTICTSDEVGTLVVSISAILAKRNIAEALTIPIRADEISGDAVAELVVGLGNDVLTTPCEGDEDDALNADPRVEELRGKLSELQGRPTSTTSGDVSYLDDFDLL